MLGELVSKYRILEEIGRGAMGIVFKAQDTFLGRFAAVKILAEKLVDDPEMLHRFSREGGLVAALHHPNICTVFENGNWQGRPYIAMELLSGQALDDRLAAGPLPPTQLIEIAIGVSSALEATHAIGVVHRDIKPANLFLTTTGRVKVLDFGLAKAAPVAAKLGEDAPHGGHVCHAARHDSGHAGLHVARAGLLRTARWARGSLLAWRCIVRISYWSPAGPRLEKHGSASAELGAIVSKLMAADPSMRYQTAREARDAFERCAGKMTRQAVAR